MEPLQRALLIQEGLGLVSLVTLRGLSSVYRARGDLVREQQMLERALNRTLLLYGEKHSERAFVLRRLGDVHLASDKPAKAIELLERAAQILRVAYGERDVQLGHTLHSLAEAYGAVGNRDKQKELLEGALSILESQLGRLALEVDAILHKLASMHRAAGDLLKARGLLQRALAIEQASYGQQHEKVAATLALLNQLQAELGEQAEALQLQGRERAILSNSTSDISAEQASIAPVAIAAQQLDQPEAKQAAAASAAQEYLPLEEAAARRAARLQEPEIVEFMRPLSNVLFATVTYTKRAIERAALAGPKREVILLHCMGVYSSEERPVPATVFRFCDVRAYVPLPPATKPVADSRDISRLWPAYQRACQTLPQHHSNITMITMGYGYSMAKRCPLGAKIWDTEARLLVFVHKKDFIPLYEHALPQFVLGERVRVMEGTCSQTTDNHGYLEPLTPGADIGPVGVGGGGGTLGAFVRHRTTGELHFLTNQHVIHGGCPVHCAVATLPRMQQPSRLSAQGKSKLRSCQLEIGEVVHRTSRNYPMVQPWTPSTDPGEAVRPAHELLIGLDLAVCRLTTSRKTAVFEQRLAQHLVDTGHAASLPRYKPRYCRLTEPAPALANALVIKHGASTGIRVGVPIYVNATVVYRKLGDAFYDPFRFKCTCPVKLATTLVLNQIVVAPYETGVAFARAGDSGSMCYLYTKDDNVIRPYGLLNGALNVEDSGVVTPIEAVMEYLAQYDFPLPEEQEAKEEQKAEEAEKATRCSTM